MSGEVLHYMQLKKNDLSLQLMTINNPVSQIIRMSPKINLKRISRNSEKIC